MGKRQEFVEFVPGGNIVAMVGVNRVITRDIKLINEKKMMVFYPGGSIAHLAVYVELEKKTHMEHFEKLMQKETWGIEKFVRGVQKNPQSICNKTLFSITQGGTGIVAAATGTDGQIETSDWDERLIRYILNAADYCHQKSDELAGNVSKIIDLQFAKKVDVSEVQEKFSAVITKALLIIVHSPQTKSDVEMIAMTRVPWPTLESVGDQSEFVNGVNSILSNSIPVLRSLPSPTHFHFFLNKPTTSPLTLFDPQQVYGAPFYPTITVSISNKSMEL